jgi:hypothetical protein
MPEMTESHPLPVKRKMRLLLPVILKGNVWGYAAMKASRSALT